MNTMELGPLLLRFRPDPYPWQGTPAAGGDQQTGRAHVAAVTGPGGIAIDVAVISWEASREVAALDCYGSPPRLQRLGRGGRIGIHAFPDDEWMELRISRLTSPDWSSEFQTTIGEVDSVSRLGMARTLSDLGAAGIGTRADVLGEAGRRRNELAVSFPSGDTVVPIAAYCFVRVLPLLYGHGLDNASLAR
jgi:hypothetical protein